MLGVDEHVWVPGGSMEVLPPGKPPSGWPDLVTGR